MKKQILFTLLLLPLSLFASKILSYNIYDRTDRVDMMITFDTPFDGRITQSTTNDKIVIKLEGASIESPKVKKVNSPFLHSLSITPMSKQTQVVASVPANIKLMASRTSDGYGLRLRFKTANNVPTSGSTPSIQNSANSNFLSNLPTKKDEGISDRYYIVVGFLLIAVIALFYFKRKIVKQQSKAQNTPWLFQSNESSQTTSSAAVPKKIDNEQVSIRFQKAINNENSVVMLDFGSQSYLVLMGKSSILLDKFVDNIPTTEQEFQTILQSRHEQLEEFLGKNHDNNTINSKEPLQAYKERAASLLYNEEV
ncbi:MAG: hypothetical protein JXQ67_04785 [Campylobacterales bacterium]|nr:hypothetical protein [Campylobacterales bacterium]